MNKYIGKVETIMILLLDGLNKEEITKLPKVSEKGIEEAEKRLTKLELP